MGYARQAALVVFSLAAEFNSAYVIKQVSLVNSTLLPVGYTFIDQVNGENKTLSEVSACRFIDDERAVLVGDSGELFKARIVLQDAHLLNVTIESIWYSVALHSSCCALCFCVCTVVSKNIHILAISCVGRS